jgi:hypothetical protein
MTNIQLELASRDGIVLDGSDLPQHAHELLFFGGVVRPHLA